MAGADIPAALLRRDSVYGRFPGNVEVRDELVVDGAAIAVLPDRPLIEVPELEHEVHDPVGLRSVNEYLFAP